MELRAPFEIDDYTRWRLIEGLDDISLTLRYADEITSFEEHRPNWLPTADRGALKCLQDWKFGRPEPDTPCFYAQVIVRALDRLISGRSEVAVTAALSARPPVGEPQE